MTKNTPTGLPVPIWTWWSGPICFPPILSKEAQQKLAKETEEKRLLSLARMRHSISHISELRQFISRALKRKHHTLTGREFQQLETAMFAHFAATRLNQNWSDRGEEASQLLAEYLHEKGVVILPVDKPEPLHEFQPEGSAMGRLASLERKLKLQQKLAARSGTVVT